MARYQYFPDVVYFVTCSTINHRPLLKSNEAKNVLDQLLRRNFDHPDDKHFTYSILDNHVHFICYVRNPQKFSEQLQTVLGGSAFAII
ncbi:TPA: hypothetical protein DF272_01700 [Candidatus Falkowbacteria bacterium]|nr:hypothetical protein [Candidatus Falkowbacteria bacterium]